MCKGRINRRSWIKFVVLILLVGGLLLSAGHLLACSSIVAGKEATTDGSVLFGHNEDDPKVPTLIRKVERVLHGEGEMITMWDIDLPNGQKGEIPQKKGWTFAYLWSYMPGLRFSDSYLNEWGVSIGSHNCSRSREDKPELTPGIGYWLRRVAAERSRSAKEAVEIMGKMVETYGYATSGRTYAIADPNEVWFFSAVWGKHWCAKRVKDDHVAFIPNYYTIREVKFDHPDFMYCEDIKSYAEKRGWYNPDVQKVFDFAKIYNDEKTQDSLNRKLRHLGALQLVSDENFDMDNLPFSVKPNKKMALSDVQKVLRYHYEGTKWAFKPYPEGPKPYQNKNGAWVNKHPHRYELSDGTRIRTICTRGTQESFIMQLRRDMPGFIGNVMWRAQGRPCESVYIPWYYGIKEIPEPYRTGKSNRLKKDGTPEAPKAFYDPDAAENMTSAFWVFDKMTDMVNEDYSKRILIVRKTWDPLEETLILKQPKIEKFVLDSLDEFEDDESMRSFLTHYTTAYALGAYYRALKFIHQFEN